MLRPVPNPAPEPAPLTAASARALLRYVDRAALDDLTAAFVEGVDLPAAVLSPGGEAITAILQECPACDLEPAGARGPIPLHHPPVAGWVRCSHGLASLVVPITARTGEVLASVMVGPLALAESDLGPLRRDLAGMGRNETAVRSLAGAVKRSTAARAESAARLLARTLDTIVREAAIASENADLVATQRQANRELTVLYAVARALGAGAELRAILQRLVDAVVDQLGSDVALVGLIEQDDLVTVASCGLLTFEARNGRLKMGEGLAGRVAATGEPLTCFDMQEDPRQYLTAINSREQLHAFAGVPLMLQGATVGVLAVYRRIPYAFLESERQLLSHIADQATVAMERARLYDQERTTIGELRALHAQVERQHRALERATAVHDQLTQMVLEDAGLEAIVDTLARLLESRVVVEDQFHHVLARGPCPGSHERRDDSAPGAWAEREGGAEWQRVVAAARESRRPVAFPAAPRHGIGGPGVVAPVIVGGDLLGYLAVVERSRSLEEQDILAIGHASTVIALEMMKQRTRAEVERRLRGELLEELIADGVHDGEAVQRRAAYLGYNLAIPHAVMFVAFDDGQGTPVSPAGQAGRASLADLIEDLMVSHGRAGAMALARGDGAILAVPLREGTMGEARGIAQDLKRDSLRLKGRPLLAAIGRICRSPADFAVSSVEARRALELTKSLGRTEHVPAFEDLGIYRLLIDLPRPSDAARFAQELLGPLQEYDERHGTELLPSLDAYLAANGVLQRAAAALGVHVNTLSYRLQRIRDLTGIELDDSDQRLGAHLAIKIRQAILLPIGEHLQ